MMEEFDATDLTDAEINKMTYENAMGFFKYDPFSIRPRERCTVGALRSEAVGWDVEPHPAEGRAPKEQTGPITVSDLTVTA
jgi:hypothetical protein